MSNCIPLITPDSITYPCYYISEPLLVNAVPGAYKATASCFRGTCANNKHAHEFCCWWKWRRVCGKNWEEAVPNYLSVMIYKDISVPLLGTAIYGGLLNTPAVYDVMQKYSWKYTTHDSIASCEYMYIYIYIYIYIPPKNLATLYDRIVYPEITVESEMREAAKIHTEKNLIFTQFDTSNLILLLRTFKSG